MLSRLAGAIFRAVCVIVLVAIPSYFLSVQSTDTALMTSFVSVCIGVLVFAEYNARAPSFVEFRDSAPVNRIRFVTLFAMVFILTMCKRHAEAQTTLTQLSYMLTHQLGALADFPYSPVRLFHLAISPDSSVGARETATHMAGIAYLISVLGTAVFGVVLYLSGWPTKGRSFNLWVNLPTFEPVANGDSMDRLSRDATLSLVAGFLMPFIIPALAHALGALSAPVDNIADHTVIWIVAIWAFLPASLFMRGIALMLVVRSIAEQREIVSENAAEYSAI